MSEYERSTQWRMNVIVISSTVIIISAVLFFLTIKKLYFSDHPQSGHIHGPIKFLALSEMISWLATFTCLMLVTTIFHGTDMLHQLFFCLSGIFFIFGYMSSYLFLVCRFYYAFLDSTFAMTRKIKYFYIFTAIFIPAYCFICFHFWLSRKMFILYFTGIIGIGETCMAYLLLLYGFNHNLFELVLQHRQQTLITVKNYKKPTLHEAVQSSSLNSHQLFMIQMITKQTLLGCIHVACLLFIVFMCVVVLIMLQIFPNINNDICLLIFAYNIVITIMCGIICVYLGFVFNSPIYNCICGTCHWKCNRFCESLAEKRVEEELKFDKLKKNKHNSSISIVINHQSTITPQSASDPSIINEKPIKKQVHIEDIEIENFDIDDTMYMDAKIETTTKL